MLLFTYDTKENSRLISIVYSKVITMLGYTYKRMLFSSTIIIYYRQSKYEWKKEE